MRISAINLVNNYRLINYNALNNNYKNKLNFSGTRILNCDTVSFKGESINPL